MNLDLRERRLLDLYCSVTLLATGLWWWGLTREDWVGRHTLGDAFVPRGTLLLLLGDLFSAGVLPTAVLIAVRKLPRAVPALLWMHFGGQAYAFLVSAVGAWLDPQAKWGLSLMMLSSGCALAFALRASNTELIWGPFRFREAPEGSVPRLLTRKMLQQTAAMWLTFCGILPGMMVLAECALGWRLPALPVGVRIGLWIAFAAAGSVGIAAGLAMARTGEGTPLPSVGTRRLVVSGPYRWVRNPMALLAIVQGVLLGVALSSGLTVVYAVLGGVAWELLVRPLEERYLEERYGEDYVHYRTRVRCWIPGKSFAPKRRSSGDVLSPSNEPGQAPRQDDGA